MDLSVLQWNGDLRGAPGGHQGVGALLIPINRASAQEIRGGYNPLE